MAAALHPAVLLRQNLYRQSHYYPDRPNGHETASGDAFHQSDHTAASNKLPLGTTAKVTNLKTGKSTDVTVNDRRARARQPQDRPD